MDKGKLYGAAIIILLLSVLEFLFLKPLLLMKGISFDYVSFILFILVGIFLLIFGFAKSNNFEWASNKEKGLKVTRIFLIIFFGIQILWTIINTNISNPINKVISIIFLIIIYKYLDKLLIKNPL